MKVRRLGIILGDQLDAQSSLFDHLDPAVDAVWMAEVAEESTHVWSNKNRIAFFLSAMRHFREELQTKGFRVLYTELDTASPGNTLSAALAKTLTQHKPEALLSVQPGEWRVKDALEKTADARRVPLRLLEDTHFLCSQKDFAAYHQAHPHLRMEFFYRHMRKKTGILMEDHKPLGGTWNFDAENRRSFGKVGPKDLRPHFQVQPDAETRQVLQLVNRRFSKHPGDLARFDWPVTRGDALQALDHFIENHLPVFGNHQDAMWTGEAYLHHSRLASVLNLKLLHPMEVVKKAEAALREKKASLASVEGFIRQILGWREYVRGVYWTFMPEYLERNHLGAKEPLPSFYWTGQTKMTCMRETLKQTLELGYAHHIQRLMVTGLFSLLYGVHPKDIHRWYLAVYVDAVEWVELPNTLGMSQFGDGEVMASKPYAATGKYIKRMSNYCDTCAYDPDQRTGPKACPFSTLYWTFLLRHEKTLKTNHRMAMQLRNLSRLSESEKKVLNEREQTLRRLARNAAL